MNDLTVPRVAPLEDGELPRVAIVILNWNGRHHLAGCFDSLRALDYDQERVQVVLIDNGSEDGSVEHVVTDYPWVKLENNPVNVGFSAGCNQGAKLADDPEVLVFLNNDMRVEPDFLRQLVAPVVRGTCVATTGRMMSWDGKLLNSAGGGMNWHGIGIQRGIDQPLREDYDTPRKTLFACGGAMAMDAEVFADVGGFDEEFFAYYEDVDLGWRTWVLGHEVHYVPDAVCYHHHSSTSRRVPTERLRLLQVRNPLLACFKNYGEDNLRRVLPGMLALATRRAMLATGMQSVDHYRIEHLTHLRPPGLLRRWLDKLRGKTDGAERVQRVGMADLIGINDLLGRWEHWSERRGEVQSRRARSDEQILPLFLHPTWCIEKDPAYEELHAGLEGFLELDDLFDGLTSLEDKPH